MRARGWSGWPLAAAAIVVAGAAGGCKTLSERYIALEVWKYERCFGHLPPGFVPPGAPAAVAGGPPGRVCGQGMPMSAPMGCNECGGGFADGGMPVGVPMGMSGGVPTAAAPTGVTAGRPVVISDELVVP
jgi:hypothetical protein